MAKICSQHIFMFPFQWKIEHDLHNLFSSQINLDRIQFDGQGKWMRVTQNDELSQQEKELLYNEKNYFYKFVHDALYDNGKNGRDNLVRHFERVEPKLKPVSYIIGTKDKEYSLSVQNMVLNFYSTGVGVFLFYLNNDEYRDYQDILNINQFGRRVYPPFYADCSYHRETAKKIEIVGLNGYYKEDFKGYTTTDSNLPAQFIRDMIAEVAPNITVDPVIDDRMYTMSWLYNKQKAEHICEGYHGYINDSIRNLDGWYKYVFVDSELTCQDTEMERKLIKESSYTRWIGYDSIYGISRYSFVMLSSADPDDKSLKYLYDNFSTEYCRMAELILVQKASVLRFSQEVTNISMLDKRKNLSDMVDSLYKEYIRFVNQIHFREISAQDQAIELYKMLYEKMDLENQVEKLDKEIDELHNYVSLYEDRQKSKVMDIMSIMAGVLLPVTVVSGFFGMNSSLNEAGGGDSWLSSFTWQWVIMVISVVVTSVVLALKIKKK